MKLSVIVPVYGVEKYIARCAKSLLEQTYPDKELIFVDDASPDGSIEVLKTVLAQYPSQQVSILRHEHNRGLAAARKTGLEIASGDYIVSVDSDDYLEHNALELLARKAEETDADIIGMDCWFEWNDKRSIYRGQWSQDPKEYSRILVSGRTLPGVCLHMIRKSLYEQTGLLPIEGLDCGEDYVLTPRLCWFANRISHVDLPLYHYTQTNSTSIVHTVSAGYIRQLIEVVKILTAFYEDKPECVDALHAGQWLKKTDLMMQVARKDYEMADAMPAALPVVTSSMTTSQRIAARMIAARHWNSLWLYCRVWNGLMETAQILKGRRKQC